MPDLVKTVIQLLLYFAAILLAWDFGERAEKRRIRSKCENLLHDMYDFCDAVESCDHEQIEEIRRLITTGIKKLEDN